MRVHASIADLAALPGPVFLAIGVFDGVHLGHQAVIGRALADARAAGGTAAVVTFEPHPLRLLHPARAPRLLTSARHRARILAAMGVGHLLVLPFTPELAALPASEFVRQLAGACRPLREICVGHTWSFGHRRSGNLRLLAGMGGQLGFAEVGLPAVEVDGEIVSSTRIRAAVERGDLAAAARCLGREFTLLGAVVHGRQIGRTLGFPTANLRTHNEQFPPDGVYAVEALLAGGPADTAPQRLPGVANIGLRPTLENAHPQRTLELHLLDFQGDLYDRELEVAFRRFLRPEAKFATLDSLKTQIAADVAQARQLLPPSIRPPG